MKNTVVRDKDFSILIPNWKHPKEEYTDMEQSKIKEPTKAQLISELNEAIQELKSIEQGTKQDRPLVELLNEL